MSLLEGRYGPIVAEHDTKGTCKSIKLYLITVVVCMSSFSLGYSLQYSSPTIPQLVIPSAGKLRLSADNTSLFASLLTVGAVGGGLIAGKMSDQLGRRPTLLLSSIPFMSGWLLITYATEVWHLLVGRTLCGVGVGTSSLAVSVYLAEISTPDIRGRILFLSSLLLTIGSLSCATLSLLVNWRYLALIGSIPSLLLAIGMTMLPETPRFLVAQYRTKEAIDTLEWLHGNTIDIYIEMAEIEEVHRNGAKMKLYELFRPPLIKPLMISLMCMLFQQFTGFNAIYYYCTYIFNQAGFRNSLTVNLIANAVLLFVLFVAVGLIDRVGRKMLLLISGGGVIVSCTLFGLFFQLQNVNHLKLDWLAIASVLLFLMFFGLGWSAIPWLLMSELLPTKARGIACSISTCFNWTCGFLVAYFFIDIEKAITSQGVFWFFASCTLVAVLFIYKFLPETKGKSLEEIQVFFDPVYSVEEPRASYGSDILDGYKTFDKTQSWSVNG